MKKYFISLLVIFALCFSACGDTTPRESTTDENLQAETVPPHFYIDIGADTLADRIKTATGADDAEVTYGDVSMGEDDATGSIAVTIGENTITLPVFSHYYLDMYDRYTGGFRVYEDCLVYYYGDSVQFYSLPSLEKINGSTDYSAIDGQYIVALNKAGDDYYLLYTGVEKEGFGKIDANGNFTDMPVADGYSGNFFSSEDNNPAVDYIKLRVNSDGYTLYHFEINGEEWLLADNALGASDDFMYSVNNGNMFYIQQTLFSENTENDIQVHIIQCSPAGYYPVKTYDNLAMRVEKGKITHLFGFDGEISGAMYINHETDGEYGLQVRRNDDFTRASFYHEGCKQGVDIDFNEKTAEIYHHNLTLPLDNYAMKSYKDQGELALYCYPAYGGGDVSVSTVVLRNERFGWLKYIDDVGGMYGGGESTGFFLNGDIYSISRDDFKIYTNDFKEEGPVFRLSDNFPLGSYVSDTVGRRVLFAARRNPDDHSFIVLYTDIPYCDRYNDMWVDSSYVRLKSEYKVGLLDSTGKLIKSWSTGENAGLSGFYGMDMYLDGDELHFIEWVKGPSNVNIHGIVDITTGEYTKIQ